MARPQRTMHDVTWIVTIIRRLALSVLRLRGWRIEGTPPPLPRFVLVAAPHTSAWDVPLMLAAALRFRLRLHFLGLSSYFRWPVAGLLRWLGGVPITRGPAADRVRTAAALMTQHDSMVIAVAPEGSRHLVPRWRTGFYHLAVASGVPLVLTALDHEHRTARFGPTIHPSGDIDADLVAIRDYYDGVRGRHPQRQGPITVSEPEPPGDLPGRVARR